MTFVPSRRIYASRKTLWLALLLASLAGTRTTAATRFVSAGQDLQAVLNAAQPGDEIVLQAGARFVGEFHLPAKPAGAVITIRSSASLPERRVAPSDAPLMPTISSGSVAAAIDATGAANWRIDGVQFESTSNGQGEVIILQNSTNIYLDRLLIVAGPVGQKRGVRGNGRQITLTRSYIANIWRTGQDSQAFCAWDGAGPYTLTNNYLEAASENVMFGGSDGGTAADLPSDILIDGNYFTKRLEWKGQGKAVKNLFELKVGRRVTIRGNLFEHNWTDAQNGYGIVIKVANQDGGNTWNVTEDVLFENNLVRDTEHGFNMLGNDYLHPSGRATRITIRNNLIITPGTAFQAGSEVGQLTIDHNTVDNGYTLMSLYAGDVWNVGQPAPRPAAYAVQQLTFTNNLTNHNDYGIKGDGTGTGTVALVTFVSNFVFTNNVLAGGAFRTYPSVTWLPYPDEYRAQLESDYTLIPNSIYHNLGTDGRDLGAAFAPPAWPFLLRPKNLRVLGNH
jgi:hypothetical protein